jgi:hypothetical protein
VVVVVVIKLDKYSNNKDNEESIVQKHQQYQENDIYEVGNDGVGGLFCALIQHSFCPSIIQIIMDLVHIHVIAIFLI